jgi:nitroimidazol reductase NimA-like FMN-containing flavoprotein (pyridoxamine 5'-phosphate oxidase superfamily)
MDSAGLEVLTDEECFGLLGKVTIGRIVFTDRALPAVQPVTFAMDDRSVVIRTASRSRLAVAATGTVVAFEADEFRDDLARSGWSVVAVGRAARISDDRQLAQVRRLGLQPWAAEAAEYYLRMTIEIISGRRLQ